MRHQVGAKSPDGLRTCADLEEPRRRPTCQAAGPRPLLALRPGHRPSVGRLGSNADARPRRNRQPHHVLEPPANNTLAPRPSMEPSLLIVAIDGTASTSASNRRAPARSTTARPRRGRGVTAPPSRVRIIIEARPPHRSPYLANNPCCVRPWSSSTHARAGQPPRYATSRAALAIPLSPPTRERPH